MKDGRARLAHKLEHAVDQDSRAILAAPVHPGDAGDTTISRPRPPSPRPTWRRSIWRQRAKRPRRSSLSASRTALDHPNRRARAPDRAALARRSGTPGGRFPTTGRACCPGSLGWRYRCARGCASGHWRTFSIVAACGAPGCAEVTTSPNATGSASPPTNLGLMSEPWSAPAPRGQRPTSTS